MEKETMTLKEVAERLGISKEWLQKLAQRGKCPIPYTRLSERKRIFKTVDVENYIKEHTYAGE